jgi:hypothetical protein
VVLVVGHFAVPFFGLLSRRLKRSPVGLAWTAAWLLAFHSLDVVWMVVPAAPPLAVGPTGAWQLVPALLGAAGLTVLFVAWRLAGRSLVPVGDPDLPLSLGYRS